MRRFTIPWAVIPSVRPVVLLAPADDGKTPGDQAPSHYGTFISSGKQVAERAVKGRLVVIVLNLSIAWFTSLYNR